MWYLRGKSLHMQWFRVKYSYIFTQIHFANRDSIDSHFMHFMKWFTFKELPCSVEYLSTTMLEQYQENCLVETMYVINGNPEEQMALLFISYKFVKSFLVITFLAHLSLLRVSF